MTSFVSTTTRTRTRVPRPLRLRRRWKKRPKSNTTWKRGGSMGNTHLHPHLCRRANSTKNGGNLGQFIFSLCSTHFIFFSFIDRERLRRYRLRLLSTIISSGQFRKIKMGAKFRWNWIVKKRQISLSLCRWPTTTTNSWWWKFGNDLPPPTTQKLGEVV